MKWGQVNLRTEHMKWGQVNLRTEREWQLERNGQWAKGKVIQNSSTSTKNMATMAKRFTTFHKSY